MVLNYYWSDKRNGKGGRKADRGEAFVYFIVRRRALCKTAEVEKKKKIGWKTFAKVQNVISEGVGRIWWNFFSNDECV